MLTNELVLTAKSGDVPRMIKILYLNNLPQSDCDVNQRDPNPILKWTPLIAACRENREAAATILLAHNKIDVNLDDAQGDTALHHASFFKCQFIASLLLRLPSIGKSVNKQNIKGQTPLGLATLVQAVEIIELLLARPEVDINVKSANLQTPIMFGYQNVATLKKFLRRSDLDVNLVESGGHSILSTLCGSSFAVERKCEGFRAILWRDDLDFNRGGFSGQEGEGGSTVVQRLCDAPTHALFLTFLVLRNVVEVCTKRVRSDDAFERRIAPKIDLSYTVRSKKGGKRGRHSVWLRRHPKSCDWLC